MVDDEATLTMVEDMYLSASEESVPAERSTWQNSSQNLSKVSLVNNTEQPFDHLPVSITPLPQPPDQLASEQPLNHIPCPAAPSEQLMSEQPLNHIRDPTASQALTPNVPSASGLSEQPEDENLTVNGSKVLVDLEKAFSELKSISNLWNSTVECVLLCRWKS